jgi:hypothetical protein
MYKSFQFRLPRLHYKYSETSLFSFRKDALRVLGFCAPGQSPVVIDPIGTRNDIPRATLAHESAHHELLINTSFGFFYQILEAFARSQPSIRKYCLLSLMEQWSVQELHATYTEMTVVSQAYPGSLDSAIAGLPSDLLDEPPYREVYDSVARHLPIHLSVEPSRLWAQAALVQFMAFWSMSNDCLTRFRDPRSLTDESFRLYLHEQSPHCRFEKLMTKLLSSDKIQRILERFPSDITRANYLEFSHTCLAAFRSLFDEEIITDGEVLSQQARQLQAAWLNGGYIAGANENRSSVRDEFGGLLPTIIADPMTQKFHAEMFQKDAALTIESLRGELSATRREDVGVAFAFSVVASVAHIFLITYEREVGSPWPTAVALRKHFEFMPLTGVLPTNEVYQSLTTAVVLPDIMIFRGIKSWRWWRDRRENITDPDDHIWVCCEADELSAERVRELLEFRGIGHGAKAIVAALKGAPDFHIYLVNPSTPNNCAMIYAPGETGTFLFEKIRKVLGIELVSSKAIGDYRIDSLIGMLTYIFSLP